MHSLVKCNVERFKTEMNIHLFICYENKIRATKKGIIVSNNNADFFFFWATNLLRNIRKGITLDVNNPTLMYLILYISKILFYMPLATHGITKIHFMLACLEHINVCDRNIIFSLFYIIPRWEYDIRTSKSFSSVSLPVLVHKTLSASGPSMSKRLLDAVVCIIV